MIDGDISLKSLLLVSESIEQLIGKNGAKVVQRQAGQRAASRLIDMLPLVLPEVEAIQQSGEILVELGFIQGLQMVAPGLIKIDGNNYMHEIQELNLGCSLSGTYYVIGLFEGFFNQLSGLKKKITSVENTPEGELWKLN